jgi:hypothetical protein
VPIFLKFGSLILLKPSGPVQVCNGIAYPYSEYSKLKKLYIITYKLLAEHSGGITENRQTFSENT